MAVENIMYFALGMLAALLVALMVAPAIWRRAVRLTKKRIEAATPMTMAEFRADKDQLRAEFALSTRRLEISVETLRRKLAEQVGEMSRKRTDLNALKTERDQHMSIVGELEQRESELRARVLELEKESVDLTQKLRMRERDYGTKLQELERVRSVLGSDLPAAAKVSADGLSGDYEEDVDALLTALAVERKRAGFFEKQVKELIARLESTDRRSGDANAAIAELRRAMARKDDAADQRDDALVAAEARIASAESRLNALLEETNGTPTAGGAKEGQLLAEKFSLEDQVQHLKSKVLDVESTISADWDNDRIEPSEMRERLSDIATDVSKLVYVVDAGSADTSESLFDKVQRFADDGAKAEEPVPGPLPAKKRRSSTRGKRSDRMAALREHTTRT